MRLFLYQYQIFWLILNARKSMSLSMHEALKLRFKLTAQAIIEAFERSNHRDWLND